jgi:hypothetical protein
VFIEITGESALLDHADLERDDVEEAVEAALGPDGEVTGAGTGLGRWHLDVELTGDEPPPGTVIRIAHALVGLGIAGVRMRVEGQEALPASDIAG